jgi:GNAT superfamily N-acetyltransferase
VPDLRIERLPISHPDAARLVEEVQQEYVARYGSRDDTPLEEGEFAPGKGMFFVGYVDNEPTVSGAWRWHPEVAGVDRGPCAEIKRMYVASAQRGSGHARAMLDHLEGRAAVAGAVAVILETGARQPEAIALYQSSGYLPVPGFGFYRDSPLSRCFAKLLGSD